MRILWMILVALFRIAIGLAGVAFSLLLVILAIGSEQAQYDSSDDENPYDRMPSWRDKNGNWFDVRNRPL